MARPPLHVEARTTQQVAADLRAELASAREATRRADAEVERLTRELAEVRAALDELWGDRLDALKVRAEATRPARRQRKRSA